MRSEARVVITNPTGLHARPAVKLAQLAAGFDAHVEIRAGDDGEWVRARSTARVMKLKAGAQSTIHFRAEGSQADDALSALVDFVRRDFDEVPAATSGSAPVERLGHAANGGSSCTAAAAATGAPDHHAGPTTGDRRDAVAPVDAVTPDGAASASASFGEVVASPAARTARAGAHARGESGERTDSVADRPQVRRTFGAAARTSTGRTEETGGTAQDGREIQGIVASPGLAIGILHMPASSHGPARQADDDPDVERAAFDAAIARALDGLRALADGSGGLAGDIIGFQVSLLEDVEFLGPAWAEITAGVAADRAWDEHLAREIADCDSAPTDYLRARAADLRDLRERVAAAFSGVARKEVLPGAVRRGRGRDHPLAVSRA